MSDSHYRFTTPTPSDHQPALWVLTTTFATWSFLTLLVRLSVRRKVHAAEAALIAAYVLALSSWTALYIALTHNAGIATSRVEAHQHSKAGNAVFASNILLIAAKGVAASSNTLFLREIVSGVEHTRLCTAMTALSWLAATIACLSVSILCSPQRALLTGIDASCDNSVARWGAAGFMFALQAAVNVALPIFLFFKIRIAVSRRTNAMAWFSVPPLMGFIPIGFIIWQSTSSFHNAPSGTGLVGLIVALHSSLCWDLIYPTIPCLRPTALSYATGGVKETGQGSNGVSRNHASGYSRRANKSNTFPSSHSKRLDADEVPLRPVPSREGHYANATAVYEEDGASNNSRSIRVKQEYDVIIK